MDYCSEAERQLLTVKESLHSAIGEQRTSADELRAAVSEIEGILLELSIRPVGQRMNSRDGNGAVASAPEKLAMVWRHSIAHLQREAEQALQRGRGAALESVALRTHSKQLRAAICSGNAKAETTPRTRTTILSKREQEVLGLIVHGKSSKEVAVALGISFKTAVTHRTSIMSKLDVHEIASLVREAIRRGLV